MSFLHLIKPGLEGRRHYCMSDLDFTVKVRKPERRAGYTEFNLRTCIACPQPVWQADLNANIYEVPTIVRIDAITGGEIEDNACPCCGERFELRPLVFSKLIG